MGKHIFKRKEKDNHILGENNGESYSRPSRNKRKILFQCNQGIPW